MDFKTWLKETISPNIKDQIQSFLDDAGFVFFFSKDDVTYAATEEGRLIFANMKHPNEDMNKGWKKEATFSAINLDKFLTGQQTAGIFTAKDIKNLRILGQNEAGDILRKKAEKIKKSGGKLNIVKLSVGEE